MAPDEQPPQNTRSGLDLAIAGLAVAGIITSLVLRFVMRAPENFHQAPLIAVLLLGGVPLVYKLLGNLLKLQFGSDLLAGISIVTSVILGEYLAEPSWCSCFREARRWNPTR